MSKHTPGPWRWELNEKHKSVNLCGGNPKEGFGRYDLTVLGFDRWGMNGAAPRFRDERCILHRAEKFATVAPGREHHQDWFKLIDHPDARLIEAAPEMFDLLDDAHSALIDAGICPGLVKDIEAMLKRLS